MKLAYILTQYLYTNKRLDLPGIGTFLLDPSVILETETGKNSKQDITSGITFQSDTAMQESPELISYISSQMGKMKALASADLRSHLELARQFLNIGKPFLFDGIGNLVKAKSGQYEFIPGQNISEKVKEFSARELSPNSSAGESFSEYHNVFKQKTVKSKWKKPVMVLLLVAGLGLAIWGGYTISQKKNDTDKPLTTIATKKEETVRVNNNDTSAIKKDSALNSKPITPSVTATVPAGTYKFVLEVAGSKRAFERYNRLKSFHWNVQLETKDSLEYKLFLLLPASVPDTSRIADSLSNLNGRKVFIEN